MEPGEKRLPKAAHAHKRHAFASTGVLAAHPGPDIRSLYELRVASEGHHVVRFSVGACVFCDLWPLVLNAVLDAGEDLPSAHVSKICIADHETLLDTYVWDVITSCVSFDVS
jgi:hypothetical protein